MSRFHGSQHHSSDQQSHNRFFESIGWIAIHLAVDFNNHLVDIDSHLIAEIDILLVVVVDIGVVIVGRQVATIVGSDSQLDDFQFDIVALLSPWPHPMLFGFEKAAVYWGFDCCLVGIDECSVEPVGAFAGSSNRIFDPFSCSFYCTFPDQSHQG